jgi:hypothetical protein
VIKLKVSSPLVGGMVSGAVGEVTSRARTIVEGALGPWGEAVGEPEAAAVTTEKGHPRQ